ncbi:hypothetical protein C4D60_Mb06t21410 [Musa balbisiana]|uniref:Uncharacterized protein n=1 Tax=Musa balbisiana TaxID=52838 RepID=A0A4S8IPN5_MUSBA|nr:hypothetical protein C4D60_Mb06t21410 [Musa balbisiana]
MMLTKVDFDALWSSPFGLLCDKFDAKLPLVPCSKCIQSPRICQGKVTCCDMYSLNVVQRFNHLGNRFTILVPMAQAAVTPPSPCAHPPISSNNSGMPGTSCNHCRLQQLQNLKHLMSRGCHSSSKVPWPSCPELFDPKENTDPDEVTAIL